MHLSQAIFVASLFAFSNGAPVGPLTAALGATVGALGESGAAAAFSTAGLGAGLILKKLATGDGSVPRFSLFYSSFFLLFSLCFPQVEFRDQNSTWSGTIPAWREDWGWLWGSCTRDLV